MNSKENFLWTIYDELKGHGRPLHYTVIAKIVRGKFENFSNKTDRQVLGKMIQFKWMFTRISEGVYYIK